MMATISTGTLAQALVQGIEVPIPVSPKWTDKEKADAKKFQDSCDSIVDIQLKHIQAHRVDWVTFQLKQIEQILTNDED